MFTWENILDWFVSGLFQNFVWVIVGVLIANFIRDFIEKRRYGRWRVIVKKNGEEKLNRSISPRKAREILTEPADKAVFLKGVASPYGWINCDLIEEGVEIGLLSEEQDSRRFVIDLDKNPPGEPRRG